MGLAPLDRLLFTVEKEKIVATPIRNGILSLYGSVKVKRGKTADFKKIRREMIKKLAARAAAK